jgi:metal-responsive CopG/Arc/MetJ family transcriptional regulator
MQRSIINFSVPKEVEDEIEKLAKKENKTKSELLRQAFQAYKFSANWAKLRVLGQLTAEKFNLETYDDIERIAG